ncbi:MAG TPA: hypothetical protein VFU73_02955 [Actinocrinis sp.]|nr:hypothetical protein [Actinocrinis sp.]
MKVLMWEAKGDADAIVRWLRGDVLPGLPDGVDAELFRSADRVVALLRQGADGEGPEAAPRLRLPDPPPDIVERPPHAWPFETV